MSKTQSDLHLSAAKVSEPKIIRKPNLHADWIDPHAIGIVKALQKSGHTSYLVGGCVRDLLLGIFPKDYDIATAAHPPQVKRLIHMAFIIGKRFRLVLVKRGEQQYEVATFRKEYDPSHFPIEEFPDGPPSVDNIFGTPEEDARRRDFTINALFYDPISGELIDYVNGRADIEGRVLRMIGEPDVRLTEDPIRTLRALRFSHKLGFVIEPSLRESMARHAGLLQKAVLPRRREELLKLMRLDNPMAVLIECYDLGVLREIFPTLERMFESPERQFTFLTLLENLRASVTDPNDTGQIFGWLLAAILETLNEEDASLSEDELNALLRDELGMYKFEQSLVLDALKLRRAFEKTEEHRRKGERRQASVVKREGFSLALRLAVADHRVSAADLRFWTEVYDRIQPEIEEARRERSARRSERPPRRRRERGDRPSRAKNGPGTDQNDALDDDDGADDLGDGLQAERFAANTTLAPKSEQTSQDET
jgi:poly(A) polymerase